MDSRIILIAFILSLLCFETFTLSATKPTTEKITTSGVYVDTQNFPVLTPRSVNGVYILVLKNHKSIYFVSNEKTNVKEANVVKFSGKLVDFNGMIKQNIIFPTYSGLKGEISSGIQTLMNGARGYTGLSIGAFDYVKGSGAAKKIASGYLFLTRITETMYYLSGFMDIIWTIVTITMLVAMLDMLKALVLGGAEAITRFSFEGITDAIKNSLYSIWDTIKNKFTLDAISDIASEIKDATIGKVADKLSELKEYISLKWSISRMSDTEIAELNQRISDMGIRTIEIDGQVKDVISLTKDDWKKYFDQIIDQIKEKYVDDVILERSSNDVKQVFEGPIGDMLENTFKRPKLVDSLKYLASPEGFDKDFALEITKKIESDENLEKSVWETISEVDTKELSDKLGVQLSDDQKAAIEDLFKKYHEGEISKNKLLNDLKEKIGDEIFNQKKTEIKRIIDSSPENIQDLLYSEIIGSNKYGDYLNALKNSQNDEIKTIFENAKSMDAQTKAYLLKDFYFRKINNLIGVDELKEAQIEDILKNIKTGLENNRDILNQYGLNDKKIDNLINSINKDIELYKNLQNPNVNTKGKNVIDALMAIFKKANDNVFTRFLGKIKSSYIAAVEGGVNGLAGLLERAGRGRFFLSTFALVILTNAVKDALYNWFVLHNIETGYTHGYLVLLNSSNPNEELVLLAGTRFYSRATDAWMRRIPGFDSLFTFCNNPKRFTGKWVLSIIDTWLVNIPGTEDATQVLLTVVPDRYTLILGNGDVMFDYPNKNITIDSNNNLIMSRGAPTLNGTLKEIYNIKLSYFYISPVKVIGVNDYKITKKGYEDMVSSLSQIAQGSEASLILGLNPAEAIYMSKIYDNSNDVVQMPVFGLLGRIAVIGLSIVVGALLPPPLGAALGTVTTLGVIYNQPWVIEDIGIGSTSKIALSPKERLEDSCINVVFSLLSAFKGQQSKTTDMQNYEKATNFCNKFGNDVDKVLSVFGMKSINYLPITLDWYRYGPTNNIYIPGEIHARLEITKNYNDKLALACSLTKSQ